MRARSSVRDDATEFTARGGLHVDALGAEEIVVGFLLLLFLFLLVPHRRTTNAAPASGQQQRAQPLALIVLVACFACACACRSCRVVYRVSVCCIATSLGALGMRTS